VVDVEEGTLRSFGDDALPFLQGAVEEHRRIGHVAVDLLVEFFVLEYDLVDVKFLRLVDLLRI